MFLLLERKEQDMKLRTIKSLYDEIRKEDPDTELTLNFLRTLVNKGIIPSIRLGKRILIDCDDIKQCFRADYVSNLLKQQNEINDSNVHSQKYDKSSDKKSDKFAQTVREIKVQRRR